MAAGSASRSLPAANERIFRAGGQARLDALNRGKVNAKGEKRRHACNRQYRFRLHNARFAIRKDINWSLGGGTPFKDEMELFGELNPQR
ncbi:MAG: hypothetical protein AB7I42_19820 [Bradyrhizobium sp.]|uniref:hypothetical protein n=1 Tax=Bradyrhizobium sp. TaxID=376 RepID=UPI003D0F0241